MGARLSRSRPDGFSELRLRAERLDTAWLMALSPMLILLPAEVPPACRALAAAASRLDLRPRLVRLGGEAGRDPAPIEALDVRAQEILDLAAADATEAFARLADWASPSPPASLWAPWRAHDRRLFDLADRLADSLAKPPVVFEYPLAETVEALPADARAFRLEDGSTPLYLVLD